MTRRGKALRRGRYYAYGGALNWGPAAGPTAAGT